MGLLWELKSKYKTVSIVGLAKNAGKTTALNYLIEEAMDEGLILGITSTGRDGESSDLVTGTEKPKVFLDNGTIVSVPVKLYEMADAGLEILKMTDYHTTLGKVMICRVASSGYVQIAGPVTTADSRKLCIEMEKLGAELVIVDGAIDRKSIAAPDSSDAVILSTGAVLSRSMKKVVEETAYVVGLYGLDVLGEKELKKIIKKNIQFEQIMIINKDQYENPLLLNLKTALNASKYIDESVNENTEYIFLPGALTKSVVADINFKKFSKVTFIIKDPTKIFIDSITWQQLIKQGFKLKVLQNIKVAAITVNPYAPAGYAFDHRELLDTMKNAIKGIPIIDVKI